MSSSVELEEATMPNLAYLAALATALVLSLSSGIALGQTPGSTLQIPLSSPAYAYQAGATGKPASCPQAFDYAYNECLAAGLGQYACQGAHESYTKTCRETGRYWSQMHDWQGLRRD